MRVACTKKWGGETPPGHDYSERAELPPCLRVGFSLTLIGTVLGEMFAAQHGLGYLLMNAISLYNIDVIMSVTFLLVVFAAGVNAVLLAVDRRLHFRA